MGDSAECLQAGGDEPVWGGREEVMVQGVKRREAARLLEQVKGWSPQQGRGHKAGCGRLRRGTLSSQWAREQPVDRECRVDGPGEGGRENGTGNGA